MIKSEKKEGTWFDFIIYTLIGIILIPFVGAIYLFLRPKTALLYLLFLSSIFFFVFYFTELIIFNLILSIYVGYTLACMGLICTELGNGI